MIIGLLSFLILNCLYLIVHILYHLFPLLGHFILIEL